MDMTLLKRNEAIQHAPKHQDKTLRHRHLDAVYRLECFCDSTVKSKLEPGRQRYAIAIRLTSDDSDKLDGNGNFVLGKSIVMKRA
eukprot:13476076-Heterocapsa_arctica.AAC.1